MRVLADTNIWCDFFNRGEEQLTILLEQYRVAMHPIVLGELASGNLPKRSQALYDLKQLPQLVQASCEETLLLIDAHRLYGKGLHWNDLLLLASVITQPGTALWTRDAKLKKAAQRLDCSFAA